MHPSLFFVMGDLFYYQLLSAESEAVMPDQINCKVEPEECDAYEENQEEPVAMMDDSPPSVGPDGMY